MAFGIGSFLKKSVGKMLGAGVKKSSLSSIASRVKDKAKEGEKKRRQPKERNTWVSKRQKEFKKKMGKYSKTKMEGGRQRKQRDPYVSKRQKAYYEQERNKKDNRKLISAGTLSRLGRRTKR